MTEVYEILHHNAWLSLWSAAKPEAGVDGYIFSHETSCDGRIVAILPFREVILGGDALEFLVKNEMTPCWGFHKELSSITGCYEGEDIAEDAIREMLEETGYVIHKDELLDLGESFASKSSDTIYQLYSVNLTGKVPGEAIGDGSRIESESEAVWVSYDKLFTLKDPQIHVMFLRLIMKFEEMIVSENLSQVP